MQIDQAVCPVRYAGGVLTGGEQSHAAAGHTFLTPLASQSDLGYSCILTIHCHLPSSSTVLALVHSRSLITSSCWTTFECCFAKITTALNLFEWAPDPPFLPPTWSKPEQKVAVGIRGPAFRNTRVSCDLARFSRNLLRLVSADRHLVPYPPFIIRRSFLTSSQKSKSLSSLPFYPVEALERVSPV
jgi:hypothetical protein